jgi:hypothetical protein
MTSDGQVDNRVRSQRSPDPDRTCVPPSGPNGRIRTVRRGRFPGIVVGLTSVLLFRFPTQLLAQEHKSPLFDLTTDRPIISQQVHLALPSAERGLQLLTSGGDAGQLAVAVESIGHTYKYLRAAQESTQQLIRLSKFPDALMPMEMERMWQIRVHMLACTNRGGHIIKQKQKMINMCTEPLIEGIRQRRALLAIMP